MGIPNVFTIKFVPFLGVGISFSINISEYGRTLDVGISLPFIFLGVFFRKTPTNKWI